MFIRLQSFGLFGHRNTFFFFFVLNIIPRVLCVLSSLGLNMGVFGLSFCNMFTYDFSVSPAVLSFCDLFIRNAMYCKLKQELN